MIVLGLALSIPFAAAAGEWIVNPDAGNSTFDAVFDAKLGERIHAVSSALDCRIQYDEKTGAASGSCKVPLTSVVVDNEPTKTDHFRQWTTNKKSEAKDCFLEAKFEGLKVKLASEKPVAFTAQVPFTVCGRARTDGGKEKVTGTALLFPAGTYGEAKTIRIQASVRAFDREKYEIGPGFTEGWLAKVQSLAKVVARDGAIELRLFAKEAAARQANPCGGNPCNPCAGKTVKNPCGGK